MRSQPRAGLRRIGPSLFALAVCASHGDEETRRLALGQLPVVARTATHLMQFVEFAQAMRGWGRGLRNAVRDWYLARTPAQVVYQVMKYRQRGGWTHRDLLRKCHALVGEDNADLRDIFQWVTHGDLPPERDATRLVHAFEQARSADTQTLAQLIRDNRMSWEMVPSDRMGESAVWEALAEDMPLVATMRNLGNLTRHGIIAPMKFQRAVDALAPHRAGRRSLTIHPISVLQALLTYRSGKGLRGRNTWEPVPQVVDALDAAFERSFRSAPRTGSRLYLAVDVSGSMSWGAVAGVEGLTPRMAAAAMAMAAARREPNHVIRGFAGGNSRRTGGARMAPLDITAGDSLTDAMRRCQELGWGPDRLRPAHAGCPGTEAAGGLLRHPDGQRDLVRQGPPDGGAAAVPAGDGHPGQAGGGGHGLQRVQHRRPRGRRRHGRGGVRHRRPPAHRRFRLRRRG